MLRRQFLIIGLLVTCCLEYEALAAKRKSIFKIKTKNGGIIGNILIKVNDQFVAVAKLMKRYPGCEILDGRAR